MNAAEYLGARRASEGRWTFEIGSELHGAFGGAFGGVVASACLVAARGSASDRVPAAIDCRFLKGLPAGRCAAEATVVRGGRSLSTVQVDVTSADGAVAARALVALVDPTALAAVSKPTTPTPPPFAPYEDAQPWGPVAPIVSALDPRVVHRDGTAVATAIRVPWDDPLATAEAVCLAADMCVGPPVGLGMAGEGVAHPNPDISLRFCGDVTGDTIVAIGRMDRAAGGVALVRVDVWSGDEIVAAGVSTSLLLPAG